MFGILCMTYCGKFGNLVTHCWTFGMTYLCNFGRFGLIYLGEFWTFGSSYLGNLWYFVRYIWDFVLCLMSEFYFTRHPIYCDAFNSGNPEVHDGDKGQAVPSVHQPLHHPHHHCYLGLCIFCLHSTSSWMENLCGLLVR